MCWWRSRRLSFDIAGLELYLPLLTGGKLVVASREATLDGRLLMQLLEQSGATIMQATPDDVAGAAGVGLAGGSEAQGAGRRRSASG